MGGGGGGGGNPPDAAAAGDAAGGMGGGGGKFCSNSSISNRGNMRADQTRSSGWLFHNIQVLCIASELGGMLKELLAKQAASKC